MTLKEYMRSREDYWKSHWPMDDPLRLSLMVERDVRAAEAAGVTWDPEEPEVLWEVPAEGDKFPAYRITAAGEVQALFATGKWTTTNMTRHPVGRELTRRLLEEHGRVDEKL